MSAVSTGKIRLSEGKLEIAFLKGDLEGAVRMIDKVKFDPDRKIKGYPLLVWASVNGWPDLVEELIKRGANVAAEGLDGLTALKHVERYGSISAHDPLSRVIKILLDNAAEDLEMLRLLRSEIETPS
jgi:ankyrin repeat protein